MRSINKRGKFVDERLAWGKAVLGEMPSITDWIEDGERLRGDLVETMHGEEDPHLLDQREFAHWQKYGRGLDGIARGMGMPGVNAWLQGRPSSG
jgi:hypothetical protein